MAPIHFNSKIGLMEFSLIGPNTLVLFSNCLWKIFSPQMGVEMINSRNMKKITFPEEATFDFFSFESFENVMLSSTAYNEAREVFDKGGFSGFFPPQTFINETTKCVSDTSDFERYLKSDDTTPIFLCFINLKSAKPFEVGQFSVLDPFLQFNYLDLTDKANVLFSKYVYHEMLQFVQRSAIVQAYFGTVEAKSFEIGQHESPLISPLTVGVNTGSLAPIDIFLKFPDSNFFLYFSPQMHLPQKDGWISAQEFNKLYSKSVLRNKKEQTLFPNVRPYPDSSSYFSKPFFLFSLNFGKFNFSNGESGIFSGETSGARGLICMVNYSAQTGLFYEDLMMAINTILMQVLRYATANVEMFRWREM